MPRASSNGNGASNTATKTRKHEIHLVLVLFRAFVLLWRHLFVPERLRGIEAGGLTRRIDGRDETDEYRDSHDDPKVQPQDLERQVGHLIHLTRHANEFVAVKHVRQSV